MSWDGKVYVTASNPFPGQLRPVDGARPDASGNMPMLSDNGIGVNTYIAGGSGPDGSVVVSGQVTVSGLSGSFSGGPAQPVSASNSSFVFQTAISDTLLSASNRVSFTIFNDSDGTYLVKLGAPADQSVWSFYLYPGAMYESPYPSWKGSVYGIGWSGSSTATGNIVVEELF